MKIEDREIVEWLAGRATPENARRLEERAASDPEFSRLTAQWRSLVPALNAARNAEHSRRDRALQSVALRLGDIRREPPAREAIPDLAVSRRAGYALAAAAAAVALAVGFAAWMRPGPDERMTAGAAPNLIEDFSVEHAVEAPLIPAPEAVEKSAPAALVAHESPHARSLIDAISDIQPGGVLRLESGEFRESIRVSRPMRLEAVGGPVTIGQL